MGIMTPSLNGIRSISILSAEVGRDMRMRRQVCCKCVLKRAEKYVLWNKLVLVAPRLQSQVSGMQANHTCCCGSLDRMKKTNPVDKLLQKVCIDLHL